MIGDGFGEGFVCLDCREAPGVETVYFEDGPVMRDFSREACARCRSTVGGWRWWCFLDLELLDEPADTAQAITRSQWRKINDQDLDDGLDI